MGNFKAVFKREFQSYFSTPIALIFLVVFLVLSGFFTFKLGRFYDLGQADLRAFFAWHPWLFLFIVPAVSMRLWAEERRSGTIELLLTLPVSLWEAMLAKFAAAWVFLGLALTLTFPMVITVMYLGDPDLGVVIASYIGSFLMAGAFLSVGIFVSAMTKNQVISFVIATSICLLFILMGFEPVVSTLSKVLPAFLVEEISNLGFPFHFDAIQRGVIDFRDVLYFVSTIVFFLLSGVIVLERSKAD
jgi:ABC-2 type transport system permease protein